MTSMVATGPQMTSMYAQPQYAQPATYAAAPTMTSMYATPAASMYAPYAGTTTIAAAPMVETYAAPTMITQTPSYVAAPQQYVAAPQQYVQSVVPAPVAEVVVGGFAVPVPMKLTTGLPEPATLEAEKVAYGKALDAQLAKQVNAINEEAKIKRAMVDQQAKTQLAQFQLQVEEQLKMSCLQVDQEAQTMCSALQEAAITQQTARDEQTAIQTADYLKKRSIEDMSVKSWELQKQWFDQETKMVAQYEQVRKAGSKAVVSPQMVI
jgi:hypothetical protein